MNDWESGDESDIWDEIDLAEEEGELIEENKYLANPYEGLKLIANILRSQNKSGSNQQQLKYVDRLIDNQLVSIIGNAALHNELDLYRKLSNLSDKITNTNKLKLLRNKTVIGLGGRFSAGKSKFINSIMKFDESLLPEDQNPTTSIPTYVVKDEEDRIFAHTFQNQEVELDFEGMKALTHSFFSEYNLGFSKIIANLAIKNRAMPYDDIAFLDTPGYNKADAGINNEYTDNQKALTNLKGVDFLIWLMDGENGDIAQKDIKFLKKVNVSTPVLIVLNKADKNPGIAKVVAQCKSTARKAGIDTFGITAYSSLEGKEYFEENLIERFFENAQNYRNRIEDVQRNFTALTGAIGDDIKKKHADMLEKRNVLGDAIYRSGDILNLKALAEMYSYQLKELHKVQMSKNKYQHKTDEIGKMLRNLKLFH